MKILVASSICPEALTQLSENHDVVCAINGSEDELCAAIKDCHVLVFRSGVQINQKVLAAASDLKLLIRAGSGLDNLDFDYSQQRGMNLVRIPEPGAQAVAELAFGMMINLAREIRFNDQEIRQGNWTKLQTTGYVLRDKVLGIIGAGNIGSRVGQMGTAWGMKAIGCVDNPAAANLDHLARCGVELKSFEEVVKNADFLTIHVPKATSTENLINEKVLSWMKPNSFLINLSRGGVVNEAALFQALTNGRGPIGAAMDVHENEGQGKTSPLAELSNVILTPHIGATTVDTMREIGIRVIETVMEFKNRQYESNEKETDSLVPRA